MMHRCIYAHSNIDYRSSKPIIASRLLNFETMSSIALLYQLTISFLDSYIRHHMSILLAFDGTTSSITSNECDGFKKETNIKTFIIFSKITTTCILLDEFLFRLHTHLAYDVNLVATILRSSIMYSRMFSK